MAWSTELLRERGYEQVDPSGLLWKRGKMIYEFKNGKLEYIKTEHPKFAEKKGTEKEAKDVKIKDKKTELTREEFSLMEKRDEEQILSELKGDILEEYVYKFRNREGREIIGLSFAGVKTLIQKLGCVQIQNYELKDLGGAWICTVQVRDTKRNIDTLGTSVQMKKLKLKSGIETVDEFSAQKATSKALRNAWRHLLPETILKEMVKEWLSKKEGTWSWRK